VDSEGGLLFWKGRILEAEDVLKLFGKVSVRLEVGAKCEVDLQRVNR
jgi:hypothetical protein